MQSMSVERNVARSHQNIVTAEAAARAGLDAAIAQISSALPKTGNTATNGFVVWSWCSNAAFTSPYTGILTNALSAAGADAGLLNTVWLVSSLTSPADPETLSLTGSNSVNMNAANRINSSSDPIRADWVPLGTNNTKAVVRYGYWVEDDQGRLPIHLVGNAANTLKDSGRLADLAVPTNSPSGIPAGQLQALVTASNRASLQGLGFSNYVQYAPSLTNSPTSFSTRTVNVGNLINYGPFALQARTNVNLLQSSNGLNSFVSEFDKFVQASLPDYAVRKNSTPGNLKRIAAAIYDYIDSDSVPSLSPNLATALTTSATAVWPGATDADAYYGIEAVPRINEYLCYYGNAADSPSTYSTSNVTITRVIELWNMSQKTVNLSDMSVRLFAQQRYAGGFGSASVPALDETITAFTPSTLSIAPNGFATIRFTRTYAGSFPSAFNTFRSGLALSSSGIILFGRINGSSVVAIDGYFPFQLQNNPANGQAGTSPGFSGSGDTTDTRVSLGLCLQRWASVTGTAHSPGSPNNSAGRTYQNMLNWFDMPLIGGNQSVSPISPPAFIKDAPLDYIGELGNIFDGSKDLSDGNGAPRGGKTLAIGQFDPYFRIQNGVDQSAKANYESYIKRADSALLDVFCVNDDVRINVNSPRPTSEPVRPLAVVASTFDIPTTNFPQVTKPTYDPTAFENAIIARLATPKWRDARPIRNMNDLTLLGSSVKDAASPVTVSGNLWSTANSAIWKSGSSALTNMNVAVPTGPVPGNASPSVFSGDDRSREEAFRRIANFVDVTSLNFRVFSSGQVVSRQGSQLARVNLEAIVTFVPKVEKDSDGSTKTISYTPEVKVRSLQ